MSYGLPSVEGRDEVRRGPDDFPPPSKDVLLLHRTDGEGLTGSRDTGTRSRTGRGTESSISVFKGVFNIGPNDQRLPLYPTGDSSFPN